MTLLIVVQGAGENWSAEPWRERFAARLTSMPIALWPSDTPAPESVRYVAVWKQPPGLLGTFTNLEVIFNLGAGVDALVADATLPNVPLIRVATSESWKDKQTGEQQDRTEWHRVAMFGRLAEIAAEYLRKGSQVYLEGSLRTNKWQDKDGQDRYTTEIVANEMQMLGGRADSSAPARAPQANVANRGSGNAPGNGPGNGPSEEFDDDIPF